MRHNRSVSVVEDKLLLRSFSYTATICWKPQVFASERIFEESEVQVNTAILFGLSDSPFSKLFDILCNVISVSRSQILLATGVRDFRRCSVVAMVIEGRWIYLRIPTNVSFCSVEEGAFLAISFSMPSHGDRGTMVIFHQ